ncbi:MAG: ATP-dependent DNA helicase RecG [Deltaproteobacteria bacterium]|nr:ATP-dependent DNA helicase RecG [Deltaproteobacteria bacterium]
MAGKSDRKPAVSAIVNDFLNIPVSKLKGIGDKRAAGLNKRGISTVLDLFYLIPKDYEDRTKITPLNKLEYGKPAYIKGKVLSSGEERLFRSRKNIFKIILGENIFQVDLCWFNVKKAYFTSFCCTGQEICAYGTVTFHNHRIQMYHPDITTAGDDEAPALLPVYPLIEGLSNRQLRPLIRAAIKEYLDLIIDPVPEIILKRADLPGLKETISALHLPDNSSDLQGLINGETPFHRRIIFDRFLNLTLRMSHDRQQRGFQTTPPLKIPERMFKGIKAFFPFPLTGDQQKCIEEIREDLISGRPMNRLIMGDVGTGKTLVAVAASYMAIKNSLQVAVMAPTQLLAEQHMAYFCALPPEMGFKPVLLTSALKRQEKERIYDSVKDGTYNIVIGTHALIQERLNFDNLGLAVIDEQHRFGVNQRSMIIEKGKNTHVLSMSATPIPRTIALTIYYDRDVSIIAQYPGTHIPVSTILVERAKKRWIFDSMNKMLEEGSQVYIICPLIDESENMELKSVIEMAAGLKKIINPRYRVEYLHGQMEQAKKDATLKEFREGKIAVLVATTVIEVGIHVPNASLMIIEHPERLGLAQLHQLRGRVGRGGKGGTCILVSPESMSEMSRKRLSVMEKVSDGFEIARMDMEFRGHGEITGTRQSGLSEFELGEIFENHDLFRMTGDMVKEIFEKDPDLKLPEHRYFRVILERAKDITI